MLGASTLLLTEADVKALTEAMKEAHYMGKTILSELYNAATIALGNLIKNAKYVKHFILLLNFIRQELQNKTI